MAIGTFDGTASDTCEPKYSCTVGAWKPDGHVSFGDPPSNVGCTPENPWADFNGRELLEIKFDRLYADEYAHGTEGHQMRLLIAKLSRVIEKLVAPLP